MLIFAGKCQFQSFPRHERRIWGKTDLPECVPYPTYIGSKDLLEHRFDNVRSIALST